MNHVTTGALHPEPASLAECVFAAQFYTDEGPSDHIRRCLERAAALAEVLRFSASIAGHTSYDFMLPQVLDELASLLKTQISASLAILEHGDDMARAAPKVVGPEGQPDAVAVLAAELWRAAARDPFTTIGHWVEHGPCADLLKAAASTAGGDA